VAENIMLRVNVEDDTNTKELEEKIVKMIHGIPEVLEVEVL